MLPTPTANKRKCEQRVVFTAGVKDRQGNG